VQWVQKVNFCRNVLGFTDMGQPEGTPGGGMKDTCDFWQSYPYSQYLNPFSGISARELTR
jgi:hypothetical protein